MIRFMNKMLRPRGLSVQATLLKQDREPTLPPEIKLSMSDVQTYRLLISGRTKAQQRDSCTLLVTMPIIDSQGTYEIDGVTRTIVACAYKDLSHTDSDQRFVIDSKVQVLMHALDDILTRGLTDFFHGGNKPPENAVQHLVDSWFKTSDHCQYISTNPVGRTSIPEMIHFAGAIKKGLDLEARKFPESLLGLVDPCSTSTSEKINLTYRIVKGTKIQANKLVPNTDDNQFCSAIQNNAIGVEYMPKRLHMLRSQFEQVLPLVNHEDPWVQPVDNQLSGVHLLTAIMNMGHSTYEDAICFSESAAERMKCIREYNMSLATSANVNLLVKETSKVTALMPLMEYEDPASGNIKQIFCKKLSGYPGTVKRISVYPTNQYTRPMLRYRIIVECQKPLEDGDKVTTRGAIKGVAVVLPDNQMPIMENGKRIECAIAPESVYSRQSMVTFWEMMCNAKYQATGEKIQSRPFDEQCSFVELVNEGYGGKSHLNLKSNSLVHPTYVSMLYILRLDKIANEIVSFQDGKTYLNEQGLPVDSAEPSGQRRDLALSMNMETKGLSLFLEYMLKDAPGTSVVRDIANVVRHGHGQEIKGPRPGSNG